MANDRLDQHCRDVSKQYIAQLAVVFKCKPAKRTFVLSYFFWLTQYFGPLSRSRMFGFSMLMVEFFGSDAFLSSCSEQLEEHFSEPKDTTSNPLNRNSSILLWEVENVVAYRGLNLQK